MSRKVLNIKVTKIHGDQLLTELQSNNLTYQTFGLLIVDIVRHGANAFKVSEDDTWTWVDRERYHHTTPIEPIKPN